MDIENIQFLIFAQHIYQMSETFWWDNPRSLVTEENWKQFVPRGPVDVRFLNNLARFILYLGLASWLYFQKQEILLLTAIALLITIIMYKKLIRSNLSQSSGQSSGQSSDQSSDQRVQNQIGGDQSITTNFQSDDGAEKAISKIATVIEHRAEKENPDPISDVASRFLVPDELFDMQQGKLDVKSFGEDKIISKGIETNGLPNDNQPNMGVLPTFDLRLGHGPLGLQGSTDDEKNRGHNAQMDGFDEKSSLLLKNEFCSDAKGNHLGSLPAPISSTLQNAFVIGDKLGDNIRRDPNLHSAEIDLKNTPNNIVCGKPSFKTCGPCKFSGKTACQMATPNNPFGNVLPTDNVGNPGRGPSCWDRDDTDNKWTLAASTAAAATGSLGSGGQGLFRNVDDVWDTGNGQMSYNTLPATTIPNDRDAYQKWLYHTPYVCKDGDLEVCYGIDEIQTRKAGQILSR